MWPMPGAGSGPQTETNWLTLPFPIILLQAKMHQVAASYLTCRYALFNCQTITSLWKFTKQIL